MRDTLLRATATKPRKTPMPDGRTVVLAADPGVSGAIAVLADGELMAVHDMPTITVVVGKGERRRIDQFALDNLVTALLLRHVEPLDRGWVLIEEVWARPKEGPVQAFTFGEAYGLLRGIMARRTLPIRYVNPNQWKRDLKLRKGKDASRQRAMELFPHYADQFARVKDDGRAEAALIAVWGNMQITQRGTM